MFDESKRQRAMRLDVGVSKQAFGIVKPINERIASWQSSAALLTALSLRVQRDGARERLLQKVQLLSGLVQAERAALAERARDLPAPVATSGRILDTRRALQSLEQTLEAALTQCVLSSDMDEPRNASR